MALFTLSVQCEGIGEYWTQVAAESHREALDHLLLGPTLTQFLLKHPEWPYAIVAAGRFAVHAHEAIEKHILGATRARREVRHCSCC
jgi:hypothetical protein